MNCPNCHRDFSDGISSCPHCGQTVIRVNDVIDAELVQDHEEEEPPYHGAYGRKFVFLSSRSSPFFTTLPTGIITLALAMAMGFSYGLLACIGFLFFYAVIWTISLVLRFQLLFKGHVLHPLLVQCCSWILCWLIVSKLAS